MSGYSPTIIDTGEGLITLLPRVMATKAALTYLEQIIPDRDDHPWPGGRITPRALLQGLDEVELLLKTVRAVLIYTHNQ